MTLSELWTPISAMPIFWLCATLLAYQLGIIVYKKSGYFSLLAPVIVAITCLITLLLATDTPYETYFAGGQFIHLLLGPATVALAIPLYDQRRRLAKLWAPLLIGVVVGSFVGIISTIALCALFGASFESAMSLVPKSVTTPIAMGIAEKMKGIPEFTACIVVITGIVGAIMAAPLYKLFGIKKDFIKGFALGLSAHGMGTSRAFQISEKAGAFSGLAMGLTGIVTALIAPYVTAWILPLFYP